MKRWLAMVGAIAALVLVIGGIKAYSVYRTIQGFKAMGEPKMTVSATTAQMTRWQPRLAAFATLHAVRGADLSSEVAGIVESIEFKSGEDVAAGQLLVRLRAADDIARLKALEATENLDKVQLERDRAQFEAQAVSQATIDSDTANLEVARAQVAEQQAIVNKKFIRAPFAGRIGIRAVDPGQYVAAGTKLVTLQALNPIYADFNLPQQDLPLLAVGEAVDVRHGTAAEALAKGRVEAINPQVDSATRNVLVRASIDNAAAKFLPGMYVDVEVEAGEPRDYLLLPQAAIAFNPYGASVFVIKTTQPHDAKSGAGAASAEQRVEQRFVVTGPTRGDQVAVVKGLEAGDLVVTSGQLKLKNHALVVVDNSVTPANEAHPNPENE